MERGVKKIIFSSSATVYGDPEIIPITEDFPQRRDNKPLRKNKSIFEDILMDTAKADKDLTVVLLRYFNPVGAHESGRIGEDPRGDSEQSYAFYYPGCGGGKGKSFTFSGTITIRRTERVSGIISM